ncbi:DDE superfamily endonuclease [Popillia japonica]|uniref:DDE superfamily endonuclease n=1 Tax=Popillia japonica TaxID=7064 RepID=A0AAW1LWV2_POPJA
MIISKSRAAVSEEGIRNWFVELKKYIDKEKLNDAIEVATRIFNCDEIGMNFCPKEGKLLGPRNYKNFYEIASGPEKENITVLCNCSAVGITVPPLIVLPYKRIPRDVGLSIPDNYFVGRSDSGWMVSETFFEYISNCFSVWLKSNNIKLPVILVLDGHKSHVNLGTVRFCSENGIVLYCPYSTSTHIMQPCDVAILKPLKSAWKKVVEYKHENQKYITKLSFAPLFKKALDKI